MIECIVVGAGGFIGAVCRYLIGLIPLDKDIFDQYSRFFSHWGHRGSGTEKQRAESKGSIISESGNLRRVYHLFLFHSGDRGSDQRREHPYCAALCSTQLSDRSTCCVCRAGCGQRIEDDPRMRGTEMR